LFREGQKSRIASVYGLNDNWRRVKGKVSGKKTPAAKGWSEVYSRVWNPTFPQGKGQGP